MVDCCCSRCRGLSFIVVCLALIDCIVYTAIPNRLTTFRGSEAFPRWATMSTQLRITRCSCGQLRVSCAGDPSRVLTIFRVLFLWENMAEREGLLAAARLVEPGCLCSRVRIPCEPSKASSEPLVVELLEGFGGERGIRTLEGLLTLTPLARLSRRLSLKL
jgi:hypothetical protein